MRRFIGIARIFSDIAIIVAANTNTNAAVVCFERDSSILRMLIRQMLIYLKSSCSVYGVMFRVNKFFGKLYGASSNHCHYHEYWQRAFDGFDC